MMEKAGMITGLTRQVQFELIPAIREGGKVKQRATSYIADFVYKQGGQQIVEDSKGIRTEVYKLKKKLMLWRYGIEIKEV